MITDKKYQGINLNKAGDITRCANFGEPFSEPMREKADITRCFYIHSAVRDRDTDSYLCPVSNLPCKVYKYLKEREKEQRMLERACPAEYRNSFVHQAPQTLQTQPTPHIPTIFRLKQAPQTAQTLQPDSHSPST